MTWITARKEIRAEHIAHDALSVLLHRRILKVDVHDVLARIQKDSAKSGDPFANAGHRILDGFAEAGSNGGGAAFGV